MMTTPGTRWTRWTTRHPWTTVALGLLLVSVSAAGLPQLRQDVRLRVWFDPESEALQRLDDFERRFASDEALVVLLHSPSGIFDGTSARALGELTERMWDVPGVTRVDSLSNTPWVRAEQGNLRIDKLLANPQSLDEAALARRRDAALADELLPGYLVSADARTAVVLGWLQVDPKARGSYAAPVGALRAIVADFDRRDDHRLYIAGPAVVADELTRASERDFGRILPLAFLSTLLLLALVFRRVKAVVLPVIAVVAAIVSTLGASGWLGIAVDNVTFAVPQIVLALTIATSVHVLTHHFRSVDAGLDSRQAALMALDSNLLPTLLTAASTAIGFLSFATGDVPPIRHLGLLAGIGSAYAWLYTYLLLGPLLAVGKAVARPRPNVQPNGQRAGLAARISGWTFRNSATVCVFFAAVAVLCAVAAARNTIDTDIFRFLPADHPTNVATDFFEREVGGAMSVELVIEGGQDGAARDPELLSRVERLQQWIARQPEVTSVGSAVDVLKQTHRALSGGDPAAYRLPQDRKAVAQLLLLYSMNLPRGAGLGDRLSVPEDALRVTTRWRIHRSQAFLDAVDGLLERAERDGLKASATGKVFLYQQLNPAVVRTFLTSNGLALAGISLLLLMYFRSFRVGLLALVPSLFPLLVGGAAFWLLGRPLDVGGVVVFGAALGIAVDDTIHFVTHYTRLRQQGLAPVDCVTEIHARVAPALLTTTAILVVAFASFTGSEFVPNVYFGIVVGIVLVTALVADLVLLPAILMVGSARAWVAAGASTDPS